MYQYKPYAYSSEPFMPLYINDRESWKTFFILKREPITIKRQNRTDGTSNWRFKPSKANPYNKVDTGSDKFGKFPLIDYTTPDPAATTGNCQSDRKGKGLNCDTIVVRNSMTLLW